MTDQMQSSDPEGPNLKAALYHAAAGRPVFPCCPRTKRPSIPKSAGGNGFKDATTDPVQLRQWWAQYPEAVPGMPTGARVGVFVLDVDDKPGKVGRDSLAQLVQEFGPLPPTVETITATGGSHLFFRHPRDGRTIPNSASQLGQGHETWGRDGYPATRFAVLPSGRLRVPDLDIRGDGGYVILPGSVMADGRRYEWEGSSDPDEGVKVAQAPDWLLAMVSYDPSAAPTATPSDGATVAPIGEGSRNDFLYRLGCSLRAKGLGEPAIIAALLAENAERCQPPLPAGEVQATAKSAASKAPGLSPEYERRRAERAARQAPRPPHPAEASGGGDQGGRPALRVVGGTDHDPRPLIQIRAGELPEAVDDAEHHLVTSRPDIFQHGTRLVRVGQWEMDSGPVERPTGAGVLIDISPDWLTDKLTRLIRWERYDARKGEFKKIDCPSKVSTTLLARVGSWHFPGLVGFVDSPTLDRTGRVVSARGYDAPSGLYLSRPPLIEAIGEMQRVDAERAGECLDEAISTFPFVTEADRSACMALIITAIIRRILEAAPIGCVSANTPGTGKSKLVDVISAIATGRKAAVAALGTNPEETEKRLDAVLLKGDTLCSFDNIDRPVKSDVLCQVATQTVKSIRVMGLSKIVEAPTNVCLLMTGNNLTLVGDLVRRCIVVNLDAKTERPELREFERDAVEYALSIRPALIRAALVISKAYLDAGCPKVAAAPFGSFEQWDRMVRRPLIWAGWPDPLQPAEAMREQDHELTGMREFLRFWRQATSEPVSAAELSDLIRAKVPLMADGWAAKYPDLQESAIQVMGDLSKWGPRELGYRLRSMAGRILDGRRVFKHGLRTSVTRWGVEVL